MNATILFQCVFGLAAIVAMIRFLYVPLRRDNLRSELRRLRDGLFDYMLDNQLPLESPAYRQCRETINSLIVLSNYATVPSFVALLIRYRNRKPAAEIACDEPLRSKLNEVQSAAAGAMMRHVFFHQAIALVVISWLKWCFASDPRHELLTIGDELAPPLRRAARQRAMAAC